MRPLPDRETERLRLTRPRPEDFDDLLRMHSDPRVMATLGGVRTEEETARTLQRILASWEQEGFGWWIARDRHTRAFVGRGGPRRVDIGGHRETEVGYGLVAEFWGRGLATELARESVRAAFVELQQTDLVCFTLPTNRASRRVMEKVGFRYERDVEYAHLPHVFYRLRAAEWREFTNEV